MTRAHRHASQAVALADSEAHAIRVDYAQSRAVNPAVAGMSVATLFDACRPNLPVHLIGALYHVGFLPRPAISDDSPRLFAHDAMEMLSRTHPLVVAIIYLPTVLVLIAYGVAVLDAGLATLLGLFGAGVVVWTLTEYWLHRGIMHWVPAAAWGPKFHFWVHGIHHDWPKDPYRLVMPPLVSIALFWIFLALFRLILGDYCWMFHAGFTFGYLAYDLTHYAYHHYTLRSPLLQGWQRHHLLHHFNRRYANANFSISIPLWDRIFHTDRAQDDLSAQRR